MAKAAKKKLAKKTGATKAANKTTKKAEKRDSISNKGNKKYTGRNGKALKQQGNGQGKSLIQVEKSKVQLKSKAIKSVKNQEVNIRRFSGEITWWGVDGSESKGSVGITEENGIISGYALYGGHKYNLIFSRLKEDYFKVSIIYSGDIGGVAYLYWRSQRKYEILEGSWEDKWFGSSSCEAKLRVSL